MTFFNVRLVCHQLIKKKQQKKISGETEINKKKRAFKSSKNRKLNTAQDHKAILNINTNIN